VTLHTLPQLHSRFRASVLGFAIGDALGFPLNGLSSSSISRMALLAEDFAARPKGRYLKGQFSCLTQMLLATAASVAFSSKIDGRDIATQLLQLWNDGTILAPPDNVTESMQSLRRGDSWLGSGSGFSVCEPSALSRSVIPGLFSETSPPKLLHDVQVVTVVTHKDPLCIAASAAIARAIQLGLTQEAHDASTFCRHVATAAALAAPQLADEIENLPRLLFWDETKALKTLSTIGLRPKEVQNAQGVAAHVTPVSLTALYAALKGGASFRSAVALALKAGGAVTAVAALTAAVVGAHVGTDGIPARLSKNVLYRDAILESADALFVACRNAGSVHVAEMVTASASRKRR
jgi:ADP-ribosyl-[dinitrogen reductase] hydrolase